MNKPKRWDIETLSRTEDVDEIYIADEMDAYIEYIREGKESTCIHCGEILDEDDKDHWKRCKKHPAHAYIADLARRVLPALDEYYITLPDKDNPDTMGRALKAGLERLAKGGE